MNSDKNILKAHEVCDWLRIPKSTLYKLCSKGEIPGTKIGKHWRFDKAMLESWFHKKIKESDTKTNF